MPAIAVCSPSRALSMRHHGFINRNLRSLLSCGDLTLAPASTICKPQAGDGI